MRGFVCNTSLSALTSASGYFSRTIFPSSAASLAVLSTRGRYLASSAQQHAMQLQQRTALHQTAAQHAAASRHTVVPCASLGALKAHQPCRTTGALPSPASHWGSSLVRPSFAASPLQHSRCARAWAPLSTAHGAAGPCVRHSAFTFDSQCHVHGQFCSCPVFLALRPQQQCATGRNHPQPSVQRCMHSFMLTAE